MEIFVKSGHPVGGFSCCSTPLPACIQLKLFSGKIILFDFFIVWFQWALCHSYIYIYTEDNLDDGGRPGGSVMHRLVGVVAARLQRRLRRAVVARRELAQVRRRQLRHPGIGSEGQCYDFWRKIVSPRKWVKSSDWTKHHQFFPAKKIDYRSLTHGYLYFFDKKGSFHKGWH
jgi:hypothetical protein